MQGACVGVRDQIASDSGRWSADKSMAATCVNITHAAISAGNALVSAAYGTWAVPRMRQTYELAPARIRQRTGLLLFSGSKRRPNGRAISVLFADHWRMIEFRHPASISETTRNKSYDRRRTPPGLERPSDCHSAAQRKLCRIRMAFGATVRGGGRSARRACLAVPGWR